MRHRRLKPPHNLRQEADTGAHGNTYIQCLTILRTHILPMLNSRFQLRPNTPELRTKPRPGRRQIGAFPGPLKQPKSNLIFQGLYLIRQRRLTDEEVFRRAAEIQGMG